MSLGASITSTSLYNVGCMVNEFPTFYIVQPSQAIAPRTCATYRCVVALSRYGGWADIYMYIYMFIARHRPAQKVSALLLCSSSPLRTARKDDRKVILFFCFALRHLLISSTFVPYELHPYCNICCCSSFLLQVLRSSYFCYLSLYRFYLNGFWKNIKNRLAVSKKSINLVS